MLYRRFHFCMLFACSILFMMGCNNKTEETANDVTNNSTSSKELTPDASKPLDTVTNPVNTTTVEPTTIPTLMPNNLVLPASATDNVTEEMYKNALLNEGNLARLAAAMKKARNGEEITVAVIGGSITQGSSASNNENSYAAHFRKWWEQAFPKNKINFVNAGIGATTSYLGVHRADKDLLSYTPDVVVVEFSVNDSNTLFFKETYEDLIRRILKQENMPAVIQLFMTMEDGTSAQMQHLLVGFTYNLPRISYGQAILKEIANNTFAWDDISPDNIHPNDKGHAIVGEILWDYLNSVYAKLDSITEEPSTLAVTPIFNEAYIDGMILDSSNFEATSLGSFSKANIFDRFPNDWQTTSGNEPIVFEVEAQNIGIMYYKTVSGKGGQFDVYIDGEYAWRLDSDFSGGWGNYADSIEVYHSDEKKLHKIEIRKTDDSTGDLFTVLGLLIS